MDMGELFDPACRGPGGAGCECEDREEWRRYCYWNHDHGDGRPKQFLLFASDNKDSQCIPREVSSQLRNMIPNSEPIKLETPDGHTYDVEFVKFGLITLTTGWRGFVDVNHIRHGDSMLFVYCGNSTFKVHIFNSPGHDKFLSCSQPPCGHDVMNEQVVPHPGHVDSSAHFGYTMLPGSFVTKVQDDKLLEWAHIIKSGFPLFVAAMDETNVNLNDCHVYIPLSLVGQFKEEIVKIVAPGESVYGVEAKKHNDDQIVLQSILSELPIFVKVMTTSTVDGVGSTKSSLAFCQEYIRASLRGITGTIFLQLEGGERKWRTTLSIRGDTTKTIAPGTTTWRWGMSASSKCKRASPGATP